MRASFILITHWEVPSSATPISFTAIIDFWDLIISFLLTRGRGKVNHNEIVWEIKKPGISARAFRGDKGVYHLWELIRLSENKPGPRI